VNVLAAAYFLPLFAESFGAVSLLASIWEGRHIAVVLVFFVQPFVSPGEGEFLGVVDTAYAENHLFG
jgi:hypothetical protein